MEAMSESESKSTIPGSCPTPLELGVSGWNILHSSAAVYPYSPSSVQQEAMKQFILSWSQLYACSWCAYHMREYVAAHPPTVESKLAISRYVCELHNEVNARMGKAEYDCDPRTVLRRWHPGYPDKMDDKPSIEEQLVEAAKKRAAAAAAQQRQRENEVKRFSDFGLDSRAEAPQDAVGWRDASAAEQTAKVSSKPNEGGRGWWFFGRSAFSTSAPQTPQSAATTATATAEKIVPPSSDKSSPNTAWRTRSTTVAAPITEKTADDDTDVDAVLRRLKRCQVYCPEEEAMAMKL